MYSEDNSFFWFLFVCFAIVAIVLLVPGKPSSNTAYPYPYKDNCVEIRKDNDVIPRGIYCLYQSPQPEQP